MKRSVKQNLSLLLCMVLLLSMLPMTVFGETVTDPGKILTEAYALGSGENLPYTATLTGKVIEINTPYSSQYKNITVTIEVPGYEDMPMYCYRIKGEGADKLTVGDTITVTGKIKNYNDTLIEFDAGSSLDAVLKEDAEPEPSWTEPDDTEEPTEEPTWDYTEPDPTEPEISQALYIVAGTSSLCGVEWYPSAYENRMFDDDGDGIYSITYYNVPAGTHKFKVTDGSWENSWGNGDDEIGNSVLELTGSNNTVEIRFNSYSYTIEVRVHSSTGNQGGTTGGNTGSTSGTMRVRVAVPEDWEQCYIYSWSPELFGGWPGTELTRGTDGYYSFLLTEPVAGLVVNSGGDGWQTEDITDLPFDPDSSPIITVGALGTSWKHSYSISSDAIVIPPYIESVPVDAIYVAGATDPAAPNWLYGEEWRQNAEVNRTTATGKIYTITYPDLPAGTYEFKFAANGGWDHSWGGGATELNTETDAVYNGQNITFTLMQTHDVTLRLDLTDFSPKYGGATYTIITDNQSIPGGTRTLTIEAPASWSEVYIYTWGTAEEFGTYPGAKVQKSGDWYKATIRKFMVNLIITGKLVTGQHQQTSNITLETDKDVWIRIREDATYTVSYTPLPADLDFRVVGDAPWMGNWDVTSTLGQMSLSSENVYQVRFPAVEPGDYSFRIARDGSWNQVWDDNGSSYRIPVTRECDVTVTFTYSDQTGEGTARVTYTPKYMGDISGDQRLSVADVSQLYAHVRRTALLTDEVAQAAGDFSGDGKLNVADTSQMYAYLRGSDQTALLTTAYRLQQNQLIPKEVTLKGTVVRISEPYNAANGCVTLEILPEGFQAVLCTRLTGEEVSRIGIGSLITVKGTLQNFYGIVELMECCRLIQLENAPGVEGSQTAIVDEAYALGENQKMDRPVTLTGQVLSIRLETYGTATFATVSMTVPGRESCPITCYRMVGSAITQITTGDTITVTGTLQNFYGSIEFEAGCQLISRTSGGVSVKPETNPAAIMAAAKQLAENEEMPYEVTLSGKVLSVDEAYDAQYGNITVTIAVSGANDQSLKCYRMKGDGVEAVAAGDTITLTGRIKNHYGAIELVYGEMTSRTSGGGSALVKPNDLQTIVDEAYALQNGASLAYTAELTGTIVELQSPYDAQYKNMTVVIVVAGREDKPIMCYRMKGDAIGNHLCVGDTITVSGKIKNYNGTVEFVSGCQMTSRTPGSVSVPGDPKQIVDAAFALGENQVLPYFASLTGVVKSINEPYTDAYKNVTLTMTVEGTNGTYDLVAYRMKGEGAATVAVGDTITVTGAIKNYVGTDKETGEKKPPVVEFDSGCVLNAY